MNRGNVCDVSSLVSPQRSHRPGQHRLHRGGRGEDRGGDGEGVQRQRLPPHAQELQPLLLSTVRGQCSLSQTEGDKERRKLERLHSNTNPTLHLKISFKFVSCNPLK